MKTIGYVWSLVGCMVWAGLGVSCRDGGESGGEAQAPEVQTFPLQAQRVTDTGEWFGYLRGKQDTDIHPHVSGFLLSQEYEDGSFVKEGDVLFRIDPAMFEAELSLAEANLQAAEASVASAVASQELAQSDVNRYTPLAGTGAVSEKDMDDARHRLRAATAAVKAAKAAVEKSRAAVEKARINLDYTVIRAPYDGVIGTALTSKGDLVSPATKLANITSVDPIRLEFSINSSRLIDAYRKYGDMQAHGEGKLPPPPPVEIVLEDGSVFPQKGRLLAMESKVSSSGLINVEGEVPNPEGTLRGGMPVRVRIPIAQRDALLVPEAAIRSVLRSDFVIVVDRDDVPHTVPVVVEGRYKVPVTERDGFSSVQEMVAVSGYMEPLEQTLRAYGYETPTETRVVTDEQSAVLAMNISSANSRMPADTQAPKGKIRPTEFSYKPAGLPVAAAAGKEAGAQQAAGAALKPTEPLYKVKVTNLQQRDVEAQDEWFGTLRGVEETDIRPQVSGFVLKQHFKDGAMVKKGDVLFTIDPAAYEASVAEARANLLAAEAAEEQAAAELDRSQADYERYAKIRKRTPGAISDKTLTDAQSSIKTNEAALLKARASIAQQQANLRAAEINLSYTTVRAPFDGRVGIHKPSVGALVAPTDAEPLVTLSSVNPMRVDFQVSGKGALSGLSAFAGANRQATPAFDVVLEDDSVYPVKGQVVSADNALNKTTGTLQVVGHVENVDGVLRSGMPVRVRAGLSPVKGAYLVPARAPMNAQGQDVLVLLKPDHTPEMLPITKGDLVNVTLANAEGQEPVLQPMQIVDVDRALVGRMLLAHTKAPSLEAVVLGGAKASDWKELVLHGAQVADARALLEKLGGAPLPDDAPAQAGVADWDALALRKLGAENYRGLALQQAGARDELDLIARGQGFSSAMEMVLRQLGFEDMQHVPVVVEGALPAAKVYGANKAAGAGVNKLAPSPFRYTAPRTVVESITADAAAPPSEEQK